jgi:hypothetical protein
MKAAQVKSRADSSFVEGVSYVVEIYNVPAACDTPTLNKILNKIDPNLDVSAITDSAQFFSPLATPDDKGTVTVTRNIKLHAVRWTAAAIAWLEGRTNTGDPTVDKLEIYHDTPVSAGHARPGKLAVIASDKTFGAIMTVGRMVGVTTFALEHVVRDGINNSLEDSPFHNKIKSVRFARFAFKSGGKTGASRGLPSSQPIGQAECRITVEDTSVAELLSLYAPSPSFGIGDLRIALPLRPLRQLDTFAPEQAARIKEAEAAARELARNYDPPRIVRQLSVNLKLEHVLRGKAMPLVTSHFIAALGGSWRGVASAVLPRNGVNRLLDDGRSETIIYFMDVDSGAAAVPANSAEDFVKHANKGTALLNTEHFTKIEVKGTPKIIQLGADLQQPQLAEELSKDQLRWKIERGLREGPLYLSKKDVHGQALVWSGKGMKVTTLEDMGPSGPPIVEDGVTIRELRTIFVEGELRDAAMMFECLQANDGTDYNIFQEEEAFVIHHKFNSTYSTEKKVDRMDEDENHPPPPPPASDPSPDGARDPPPPATQANPPPHLHPHRRPVDSKGVDKPKVASARDLVDEFNQTQPMMPDGRLLHCC